MDGLSILLDAEAAGLRIAVRGDSLVIRGPREAADLARRLLKAKPAILELLANPRKVAREAWAVTVDEVAAAWCVHASRERARGQDPRWFDDTQLSTTVGEAIKATTDGVTLAKTVGAIGMWREAWTRILLEPQRPPRQVELELACGAIDSEPRDRVHVLSD